MRKANDLALTSPKCPTRGKQNRNPETEAEKLLHKKQTSDCQLEINETIAWRAFSKYLCGVVAEKLGFFYLRDYAPTI